MFQEFRFAQKAIIYDPKTQSIVVHRYGKSLFNDNKVNGKLGLPGGRMEFGENVEEHIKREVREETGLEVVPSYPVYITSWQYVKPKEDVKVQIVAVFRLCSYNGGALDNAKEEYEDEIESTFWMKITDLKPLEFISDQGDAIQEFLRIKDFLFPTLPS